MELEDGPRPADATDAADDLAMAQAALGSSPPTSLGKRCDERA